MILIIIIILPCLKRILERGNVTVENSLLEDKQLFEQLKGVVDSLCNKPSGNCYLLHLVDLIGATMVGVKPAELLNIPLTKVGTTNSHWEECKVCLLLNKSIKLREIRKQNGSAQVFFYHSTSLNTALCSKANSRFLQELGYPKQYSVEGYVDFLVKRLNSNDFPHEIGIFLGYPLKDVLGFMGHSSLKLVKTKGWKIYGNENISNKRYQSFVQARTKVREHIHSFQ